jgi:hypothetical protein
MSLHLHTYFFLYIYSKPKGNLEPSDHWNKKRHDNYIFVLLATMALLDFMFLAILVNEPDLPQSITFLKNQRKCINNKYKMFRKNITYVQMIYNRY